MIVEKAHAKLNLALEVIQRRGDGYHDVVSIVQTIDLHDIVEMQESDDVRFECSDGSVPDADNLALIAAQQLKSATGHRGGASIRLEKRIPIAAGLGGGSADAAATLRGLNRMWDLNLNPNELIHIAANIGSDVPVLLEGGTGLIEGKGEVITTLPSPDIDRVVVVVPQATNANQMPNKTATMFRALSERSFTTGSLTRKLAARMREGGDCHPALMFNVFQQYALHTFTNWQATYDTFARLGATDIMLSGAGPAMFAIAPNKELATAWALIMKSRTQCEAFSVGLTGRVDAVSTRKSTVK